MSAIIGAAIILGVLAAIFGIVLSIASKVFEVQVNPLVEKISALMPGANCGGCGLAGCNAAAEKIASGEAEPSICPAMPAENKKQIYALLGKAEVASEPTVAKLLCNGGPNCTDKEDYSGVRDCRAALLVQGGPKSCPYACVGFGNCVAACKFDALVMKDGLPRIIESRCVSCRACEKACPRGVIKIQPKSQVVYVKCSSKDPGRLVNKMCKVGCIACKLCEKACPIGAIKVVDNLAVIDYTKCTYCGECAKKCPKKAIKDIRPAKPAPEQPAVSQAAEEPVAVAK